MDLISKLKETLEKLYANKIFSRLFCLFFLLIVVYKYSNVRTGIENISSNPETMDQINIPKKINAIKKAQDALTIRATIENEEKRKKEEKMAKLIKMEKQKQLEKERKLEKIAELNKEFTSKINKNSHILKNGDMVNVKMIMTNNGEYTMGIEPMNIPIKIDTNINNIFGRKLIGKKIGQVVIIPFKEFLEDKALRDVLNSSKKNQDILDPEFNVTLDTMKDSKMAYKIKILELLNKDKL